ncbi:energy-coupling factor ABC transporter substrate-binding protein [Streptomyces venezuelae]|uniref:energy-coupling factor ABC transporter substrate-binding protein n=1 Tax=Streptomyces venezuelae TaxID=54571 RepID=UPI00278C1C39|nr:energy-coupling factor ABC transporter substrate-binding protein [Streptomyces venezuelae]
MSRNAKINTLLLLVVAALAVLPLALGLGDHKEEPFTGADAEAETAITELRPDYEPWFSPLYEPPSGEIESALFALQAALGAGVLAYYFGLRRGRRQGAARAEAAGTEKAGTEAVGTEGVRAAIDTGAATATATGASAGKDAGSRTDTGAPSGVRAVDGQDA